MQIGREWVKFAGRPYTKAAEVLCVTVNRRGEFYMNNFTHAQMGKPEAVALYINSNNGNLMLEPARRGVPEHFPVRRKTNTGWYVAGAAFLTHHGIKFDRTECFNKVEIDPEGRLILDIRSTTVTGKMKRSDGKVRG